MLSIDGTHLENDLGLYILADSQEPILPATRDSELVIPNMHGSHSFTSYLSDRPLNPGILIPTQATLDDVQQIVRSVASLILDQYGNPKEVQLIYDYEPSRFYTAKFSGSIDINRIAKAGIFNIPFKAHDPYAYNIHYQDEITWSSKTITFADNYPINHKGATPETTVTIPTTLEYWCKAYAVKPVIEISGSANSLTITNNGQVLTFPNFANVDWILDCEEFEVFKNGAQDYDSIKLRDFWLYEGNNNIEINGTSLDITIRFKYQDRFL